MTAASGHLALLVLLTLAWRNLWRRTKRTVITLLSIAVGFGLAVFFIGLNDGSHNSMIRNAIQLGEGYLTVQPVGYLENPANHKFLTDGRDLITRLEALAMPGQIDPRISLQVLASTPHNSSGAGLEGVRPTLDRRAEFFRPRLIAGDWLMPGDARGVVIGEGMADRLRAKVGGKVVMLAGSQGGDSQAQLARVRGIFVTGVNELDDFLIFSDIGFARQFLAGEGADLSNDPVTRIAMFLDDPDAMLQWKERVRGVVAGEQMILLDWQEMMPELVKFIVLDDAVNYVFLALIMIMVVFGVVNTVLMSVLERTREFGLLRALGLGRRNLLLLVFCETILLGVLAVGAGWAVGGSAHLWFAYYGLDLGAIAAGDTSIAGTFADPVIYSELSWGRISQLTVMIFAITLATGLYPAVKAARVTPVAALRT